MPGEGTLEERTTLLRPPPLDPNKAPVENTLDLTTLSAIGPDLFTNSRQPWHPPGARGIYGGYVIAQTLASAQKTVPADFLPHSMHCYFLLAGSSSIPILYHVERVRDGRSFATRTVQARQRGNCIFTTTISFVKESSGGGKQVSHAAPLPEGIVQQKPSDGWDEEPDWARNSPFQSAPIQITGDSGTLPYERKSRRWTRARGKISEEGGTAAHLNALAYMSDSYFIGTVARINGLWRYDVAPEAVKDLPEGRRKRLQELKEYEGEGDIDWDEWVGKDRVGMLVSLDHNIYFHEPTRIKADEWMFQEMESPWSGKGRGVVMQRIFAKDGTLLASCTQEGVVRLRKDEGEKSGKL